MKFVNMGKGPVKVVHIYIYIYINWHLRTQHVGYNIKQFTGQVSNLINAIEASTKQEYF